LSDTDLARMASDPAACSKVLLGADSQVTLPEFGFADALTLDAAVADAYDFTGAELHHASGHVTHLQRMDARSPWQMAGQVLTAGSCSLNDLMDRCSHVLSNWLAVNGAAAAASSNAPTAARMLTAV